MKNVFRYELNNQGQISKVDAWRHREYLDTDRLCLCLSMKLKHFIEMSLIFKNTLGGDKEAKGNIDHWVPRFIWVEAPPKQLTFFYF